MYTIEFQKRGLPHAHMLLWLSGPNKITTTSDIDRIISAELPDPTLYPKLYQTVTNYMIHGPCGRANPKCPCTKEFKCTKFYPKKHRDDTAIDDDGYPLYKRRDTGVTVNKGGIALDNRSVVPYNPHLLMKYSAHLNVEYCNKSNSIKYLFKYVNKGPDRASLQIMRDQGDDNNERPIDEIKQYYNCRYVSPCEATWRIFAFDIHQHWPPVQRLTFHLPNKQTISWNQYSNLNDVVERNEAMDTMFLAWFAANRQYTEGRDLTYTEFPTRFVYDSKARAWRPRKRGQSIGRLNYVPHGVGELYYLRVLLNVQRGCTNYDSIRTVNGKVHDDFKLACEALGLLADDKEFIDCIIEASNLASGHQLRRLFVTLLAMNTMNKPDVVWESTWKLLADSILYDRRRHLNLPGMFCNYFCKTCIVASKVSYNFYINMVVFVQIYK